MPWINTKMNERDFPYDLMGQLQGEGWSFYGAFTRVSASEDDMMDNPYIIYQESEFDVAGWSVVAVTIYQTYPPHVDTAEHYIESIDFDRWVSFLTTRGSHIKYNVHYDPVTTEMTIPAEVYTDSGDPDVVCILKMDVHLEKGAKKKTLTFATEDYDSGDMGFFHVASSGTIRIFVNGKGMKNRERTVTVSFPLRFAVAQHFLMESVSGNKIGIAKCGYFFIDYQFLKDMIGTLIPENQPITYNTQEELEQHLNELVTEFEKAVEEKLMNFFGYCLANYTDMVGTPIWFTYTFEEYYGPRKYWDDDTYSFTDHFFVTKKDPVSGALDIETFKANTEVNPAVTYKDVIDQIILCKQAFEAGQINDDIEAQHEANEQLEALYNQIPKSLADMLKGMPYGEIQNWEAGLSIYSYDFQFKTNQSPIIPMALRKLIGNPTEEIHKYNYSFPYENNWWEDSEISVVGHYTGDYFFFVLKDDIIPMFEKIYYAPTTPFYFGTFNTYFDRSIEHGGIWAGWKHNVALFGGTCNLDDMSEWFKFLDIFEAIVKNMELITQGKAADNVLESLYRELPWSMVQWLKQRSYEDVMKWWTNEFNNNWFQFDYAGEMRLIHFIPVFGGKTISPVNRDYDSDPLAGDGIHDVIVRRDVFGEHYRSHFFTWNVPPNSIAPTQYDDLLEFDDGLKYERVGGVHNKLAYQYQFFPSRYEGCARGSHANICGQYGTLGRLPNAVFTQPLSLCQGDVISVVHPNACGVEIDFNFQYITCPYSPLTFPFWVDPYPCIELPPYEPEIEPPLPEETTDGASSPPCWKVLLRWDAPSKYHMEAYVIVNKDPNKSCSFEKPNINGDDITAVCMSPYANHDTSRDWDEKPVEFWLEGPEGTTFSVFVYDWSTFILGNYYKDPLKAVMVEIVDDTVGHPYWLSSQTYNTTDCMLLKSYNIPPTMISGVSGQHTKENGLIYVCDIVVGADHKLSFVDKMIVSTQQYDYDIDKMLNL